MPQLTYNGRYIMSDSGNRSKHRWKKLCIAPRLEIGLGALGRSCHARSKSGDRADMHVAVVDCQSALDWDPLSASKRDPFERRVRPVALAPSELAGVAETVRARVV